MESYSYRSREDVDITLKYSKLDVSEFQSVAQCLYMSPQVDSDSVKLLELDDSLLQSILQGNCLTVRGNKNDSAVLCTYDQTFEIKEAETSNSILILPECDVCEQSVSDIAVCGAVNRQVSCIKHNYFELRRIRPRLRRLKECLGEAPYGGDSDATGHKYCLPELLDSIQASEDELRRGLVDLKAFVICGAWRLLDFDYMSAVLTSILAAVNEFDWSCDCLPATEMLSALDDLYPRLVLLHVLQCFAVPIHQSSDSLPSDRTQYKLNRAEVCKHYAEMLLRTASRYNLHEFAEAWQMSVPDYCTTDLAFLEGLAVIDQLSVPNTISYFPVDDLPEDVDERFQMLFKAKEKWTVEELVPYVEGMCVDGKAGVGTLLTRYARVSTLNGVKLYSARK